ncbi:MAG TPA: RagB/SusD family nutrient uptake outer membrane protein [Rikenellaceae bacterium]|nr:RagB/SusD family nutrient uptake outer membrane protein [Rikenellaceae bacterium]
MKKKYILTAMLSVLAFSSCDLDLFPETSYNEGNVEVTDDGGESQYKTRADMEGLRNAIYQDWVKDIQEKGYLDWLVYADCRADNAYGGNPGTGELMAIEANRQDGENKNVQRDWDWYLGQVSNCNNIILNIDRIKEADATMTDKEWREWKSEAYCWRAWNLFQMSQIWGDIPLVNSIPPAITAENIEEVYKEYYPARTSREDVYKRIIEELEFAAENAPDVDPSNKFLFTKGFAHGMLARIFAEETCRDWAKVEEHCKAVEGMGYKLVDDYGQMWAYDETDAVRNTSESIFEVTYTRGSGNWVWMMFHRNAYNPSDSYSWIKWITPSRDLVAAYEKEGDTERKNACICEDEATWSNYYPANKYKFMHKVPTNASSIILMRLGEIYLLHAEALAKTGDIKGAIGYVNDIRKRAGIAAIPVPSTEEEAIDAILHERRLELAFEGFRFFDLLRHGFERVKAVHDAMPQKDSYWQPRLPLTPETVLMPVPQTALDNNPSLNPNAGY